MDSGAVTQAWDEFLTALADGEGMECPCCGRYARMYRRPLNSGMARGLIRLYKDADCRWQRTSQTKWREESKLAFWGLVENGTEERGLRRVTPKGEAWLNREVTVPKYAWEFNGECISLVGDEITIDVALGTKFSLEELLT